jgi:hypothetical protein
MKQSTQIMDHPYVCYVSQHVSASLAILSETTLDIIGRHLKVYFFEVQIKAYPYESYCILDRSIVRC